jgi:predicted nucleotidyltransferase component of viral defense system
MAMVDLGGFPSDLRERVLRLADIAQRMYSVPFLSRSLSFYGGTCLNFVHLARAPRVSLDLDLNFREAGPGEWRGERDRVDAYIKQVLADLGYDPRDIRIQASAPLTRFEVRYLSSSGWRDTVKIETGYLRRVPMLASDVRLEWEHPGTGRTIEVLTPMREEMFSNKVATLLYRFGYPRRLSGRDLFDVHSIANEDYEQEPFFASFVLDSLTRPEVRLLEFSPHLDLTNARVEGNVEDLVLNGPPIEELAERVSGFLEDVLEEVGNRYSDVIDAFFDDHVFEPGRIAPPGMLNERIEDHPGILWSLERLRRGR